jgi:hypothetical protein
MQPRVQYNKKVHEAYMTRTSTEPVYLNDDDSSTPNNVSADPKLTNISPSSSDIYRRVDNQLDFATPYFDKLQHQHPEPANSGGGGDTQHRKPTTVHQLKQPPPTSPMQRALTTDVAFLIDSTIQQSMATNEAATEKINYFKLLGGGKEPLEEWEAYEIEVQHLEASDESNQSPT